MMSKHLNRNSLSLALILSLLSPAALQAAEHDAESHDSAGGELAHHFHDELSDEIVSFTLEHPEPSFWGKEILSIALREGMRKPGTRMDTFLDYSMETLPRHWLTEYYHHNYPCLNDRVAAINAIFDLEKKTIGIVKATLNDQLHHLKSSSAPFYWPSSMDKLQAQALIRGTNNQLNLWNLQSRANAPGGSTMWLDGNSGSHIFKFGTAYQQLLDISQNGWGRSLNWDASNGGSGIQDPIGTPSEEAAAAPDQPAMGDQQTADNYGDIDASLTAAQHSSDQAMQQYNQDAAANDITTRLQGTAQENVTLVNHMNDLERQAVSTDLKILTKGVVTGALIMAGGMALRSIPRGTISSPRSIFPTHTQSFTSPALPSHTFSAPSIGGSFDGAAGQTLFSH